MASGTDRLSDLPAGVVGTILSFLPIKEAARAAVLSRRWRHAFAEVDAFSFVDHEQPIYYAYDDDCTFRNESSEQRSRNGDLIDVINAALLCRRRCAGHRDTAAPRSFRLHLGRYDRWDEVMLSQWLRYLLKPRSTGQEALTHLDLRLKDTAAGEHLFVGEQKHHRRGGYNDYDGDCPAHIPYEEDDYTRRHRYTLPTRLFSHAAVRTLCLGGCVLDLRRLAIRCCHNLVSVSINASELKVFEYRGAVPAESFLTLHGAHKISSCTIDFCGKRVYEEELRRFRKFLEHFTDTKHLHLVSTHLGADIEGESFLGFPSFPSLERLELTGYLQRGSIEAMIRILEQAPSIELLSLFMKSSYKESLCGVLDHSHNLSDEFGVPDVSIPCLRNRVREINL